MDEIAKFDTPESAVLRAVYGAGGPKQVGTTLRPEWDTAPDTAARWLHHCCTDGHRSKLGLRQLVWIFRAACRAGAHIGFQAFARLCGYHATPIGAEAEVLEAYRKAEAARAQAARAADELKTLIDNPELLARMKAAGLKVGELT